jgi:hypothetical protein
MRQKLLRNFGILELLVAALQVPFKEYQKTPSHHVWLQSVFFSSRDLFVTSC